MKGNLIVWAISVVALIVCALYVFNYDKYKQHNGYYFAWVEFEKVAQKNANYDNNNIITKEELKRFEVEFFIKNNLHTVEGYLQVYNEQGEKLTAKEFVELFESQYKESK